MQARLLGRTGPRVSNLCLGTMQFGWTADERSSFAVMDAFVEAGGNFLDTADVYSRWAPGNPGGVSEQIIGRWLQERRNRDRLIVATKVRGRMWEGPDGEGLSRAHILRAIEDSLRRLQIETIDLYQCHSPDDKTPLEETLRAFEDMISSGKVRHIGASNFTSAQLAEAVRVAGENSLPRFETLQPHYNLVHRAEYEVGLASLCEREGIGVIPYSPLAAGFLTGKYRPGQAQPRSARAGRVREYMNAPGFAVLEALDGVAAAHNTTPAAVALAWQMTRPAIVAPIVGANSPEQLADLLPAANLALSPDEIDALDRISASF